MRGLRVGITGSPATGKKTIGKALSEELRLPFLSLNEVARRAGFLSEAAQGEPVLDAGGLLRHSATLLPKGGFVIAGVFLSESVPSRLLDFVVVLRCSPLVLATRYRERGYGPLKTREDLTAEFLDSCLVEAVKAYGEKVREIDATGRSAKDVLAEVKKSLVPGSHRVGVVDWLTLIKGPDDVARFLA